MHVFDEHLYNSWPLHILYEIGLKKDECVEKIRRNFVVNITHAGRRRFGNKINQERLH